MPRWRLEHTGRNTAGVLHLQLFLVNNSASALSRPSSRAARVLLCFFYVSFQQAADNFKIIYTGTLKSSHAQRLLQQILQDQAGNLHFSGSTNRVAKA